MSSAAGERMDWLMSGDLMGSGSGEPVGIRVPQPVFIVDRLVVDVTITREVGGYLSVKFGETGDVVSATREVVQGWVDTVNTLLAERDRARDIAARLEGEIAEVKVYLRGLRDRLRMDEVDASGIGNFVAARAQVNVLNRVITDVDTLTAIPDDDDLDPLTAPDPQHPAYKALHRDAEVGT